MCSSVAACRCQWRFCVGSNNTAYLGLHVKCPILMSDLKQNWFFSTERHKVPDVRFDENMCSGSRGVPADRRTDKATPIGASHECACANALQARRATNLPAVFMSRRILRRKNVATANVCLRRRILADILQYTKTHAFLLSSRA